MSESVIFNRHNVIVTTTRLELPGQMYSMAQVTSVRAERADQHVLAGIMMVVGAVALWTGSVAFGLGVAIAGLIVGYFARTNTMYLSTAGGEVKALSSRDRDFIEDVATAVKTAIIRRG